MSRTLSNKEVQWAYERWCEGARVIDIAGALYVGDKTLKREFKRRNLERVRPVLVCPPEILGRS